MVTIRPLKREKITVTVHEQRKTYVSYRDEGSHPRFSAFSTTLDVTKFSEHK